MSDTPRTDAESREFPAVIDRGGKGHWCVRKSFAEKLERELSESNALLFQARTMLDDAAHGRIELSPSDSSNPTGHALRSNSVDPVVVCPDGSEKL